MTTVTANPVGAVDDEALANGPKGRWLGTRGIYRHYQPDVEQLRRESEKIPARSSSTQCPPRSPGCSPARSSEG